MASDGEVQVTVQNSPEVDATTCSVNRHTVQLTYRPRLESLDFGAVPVGGSANRLILAMNRGVAPLVISSIRTDRPEFTVIPTSMTLQPGESRSISVTFRPASAGPVAATLILENNSDTPTVQIPMTGVGQ
ncbi:MAG: choice-of-anchor D domain-containing protein [Acidobacteria bacterium]|nr:choice-of-anchor D domain-containing protein [Acidobacteriota bacterium]